MNLIDDLVERRRHELMHHLGLVSFDEIRRVAVAGEQLRQLIVVHSAEDCGISNLVTIEVQNRQHRAVPRRIEELVRVPARRQRARLRLTVADHAADDEIWIVERGAVRVRQRVAELATFVDRARCFRRRVARDAAGK